MDGLENASFDTGALLIPPKGAFMTFSDGLRSCPGRRFAQAEVTAVLTAIFQKYSVELDVTEWASDEEVEAMGWDERHMLYAKAIERARVALRRCEQFITLQLKSGEAIPFRFVERGRERFADLE